MNFQIMHYPFRGQESPGAFCFASKAEAECGSLVNIPGLICSLLCCSWGLEGVGIFQKELSNARI